MSYIQQPPFGNEQLNARELTLRIFGGKIAFPFLDFGLLERNDQSRASDYSGETFDEINRPETINEEGRVLGINRAAAFDGGKFGEGKIVKSVQDGVRMGTVQFMPTTLGGIELWNEPLVSIQTSKNIVKTAIAGSVRRGSVKELIASEDYKITIKGIITNEINYEEYPARQVAQLSNLYERRDSVQISNKLCQLLKISRVVITSMDLNADVGFPGVQSYELKCESDNEFEYQLLN